MQKNWRTGGRDAMKNLKNEIRNSKETRSSKSEEPNNVAAAVSSFGVRTSFGSRYSDFGFETTDKPIPPSVRKRHRHRKWLAGVSTVLLLAVVTAVLARLKPAVAVVDKASVWMDTVKRGEMLLQVRGNGTLVPEDIRWIPTINAGVVERILVLPGAAVKPDTVLVELSNPQLEQDTFETESQLACAPAT